MDTSLLSSCAFILYIKDEVFSSYKNLQVINDASLLWFQDEDLEALLAADFEIGHFIRERIVPRAVLYFTGEALEQDDDVSRNKHTCMIAKFFICELCL